MWFDIIFIKGGGILKNIGGFVVKNNNDTYMIYSVHAHLTCCLKKRGF